MLPCNIESRAEIVVVACLHTPSGLWQSFAVRSCREVFRLIGCQDVFLTVDDMLYIGHIVVVGGEGDALFEIVQTANGVKAMLLSISGLVVLAHHPHHKLLLTSHGVVGDVLQSVSYSQTVGPPRLIDYLDYLLLHNVNMLYFS